MDIEQHEHYLATITLRRSDKFRVKPEAEQIDNITTKFTAGWAIEDNETTIYKGEWAMIPNYKFWPLSAPSWIASGDLINITCLCIAIPND